MAATAERDVVMRQITRDVLLASLASLMIFAFVLSFLDGCHPTPAPAPGPADAATTMPVDAPAAPPAGAP